MKPFLLFVVLIGSCFDVKADSIFIEGGLGWNPEQIACPEVCFGSSWVGSFAIGYARPIILPVVNQIKFEGGWWHDSAVNVWEEGAGSNLFGVKIRKDFEL